MMKSNFPIGFVVAQTAKTTTRNFEDRLVGAGGRLAGWLVLLAMQNSGWILQSDLAEQVGIQNATLTHHLNALEKLGFIQRKRLPTDRRAHRVEITKAGQVHFAQLKKSARTFDEKLCAAFTEKEMAQFRAFLQRLADAAI
jgi:MarR family transcriptional regulator, transcriptional regulator for hemolysin